MTAILLYLNAMDEREIQPYIKSKIFGKELVCLDVVDSTNLKAKSLIHRGAAAGTVVIADEQTAGRGRQNRVWLSEPKKNLLFSVILKPTISPEQIGVLSLYAGLAVAESINGSLGIRPVCKWPNDLLLNGKKFCGILSEAIFNESRLSGVVVGIGINVNQSSFHEEIESNATSLRNVIGKEINRFEVLGSVLEWMEHYNETIQSGPMNDILEKWKQYTEMFGKKVAIAQNGKLTSGIALRLDKDGGLIISTINGKQKVLAGDVTVCS